MEVKYISISSDDDLDSIIVISSDDEISSHGGKSTHKRSRRARSGAAVSVPVKNLIKHGHGDDCIADDVKVKVEENLKNASDELFKRHTEYALRLSLLDLDHTPGDDLSLTMGQGDEPPIKKRKWNCGKMPQLIMRHGSSDDFFTEKDDVCSEELPDLLVVKNGHMSPRKHSPAHKHKNLHSPNKEKKHKFENHRSPLKLSKSNLFETCHPSHHKSKHTKSVEKHRTSDKQRNKSLDCDNSHKKNHSNKHDSEKHRHKSEPHQKRYISSDKEKRHATSDSKHRHSEGHKKSHHSSQKRKSIGVSLQNSEPYVDLISSSACDDSLALSKASSRVHHDKGIIQKRNSPKRDSILREHDVSINGQVCFSPRVLMEEKDINCRRLDFDQNPMTDERSDSVSSTNTTSSSMVLNSNIKFKISDERKKLFASVLKRSSQALQHLPSSDSPSDSKRVRRVSADTSSSINRSLPSCDSASECGSVGSSSNRHFLDAISDFQDEGSNISSTTKKDSDPAESLPQVNNLEADLVKRRLSTTSDDSFKSAITSPSPVDQVIPVPEVDVPVKIKIEDNVAASLPETSSVMSEPVIPAAPIPTPSSETMTDLISSSIKTETQSDLQSSWSIKTETPHNPQSSCSEETETQLDLESSCQIQDISEELRVSESAEMNVEVSAEAVVEESVEECGTGSVEKCVTLTEGVEKCVAESVVVKTEVKESPSKRNNVEPVLLKMRALSTFNHSVSANAKIKEESEVGEITEKEFVDLTVEENEEALYSCPSPYAIDTDSLPDLDMPGSNLLTAFQVNDLDFETTLTLCGDGRVIYTPPSHSCSNSFLKLRSTYHFTTMHTNTVEANFQEGHEHKQYALDLMHDFTTSIRAPTEQLLRKVLNDVLLGKTQMSMKFQGYDLLMYIHHLHPPDNRIPFPMSLTSEIMDRCEKLLEGGGTNASDSEILGVILAVQYCVSSLETELMSRKLGSRRDIGKSIISRWFSLQVCYGRIERLISWLKMAVDFDNLVQSRSKSVEDSESDATALGFHMSLLSELQKILSLAIAVSTEPSTHCARVARSLCQLMDHSDDDTETKILHSVSSPLLNTNILEMFSDDLANLCEDFGKSCVVSEMVHVADYFPSQWKVEEENLELPLHRRVLEKSNPNPETTANKIKMYLDSVRNKHSNLEDNVYVAQLECQLEALELDDDSDEILE